VSGGGGGGGGGVGGHILSIGGDALNELDFCASK